MDTIKIQLTFMVDTKHGEYRDALYFTEEEWANINQDEIDALKQARIDNWIAFIKDPPKPTPPTKEEAQILLDETTLQQAGLIAEKVKLQAIVDKT